MVLYKAGFGLENLLVLKYCYLIPSLSPSTPPSKGENKMKEKQTPCMAKHSALAPSVSSNSRKDIGVFYPIILSHIQRTKSISKTKNV